MGIVDHQAIEMDKIVSEMRLIIELIKDNGSKMNEAIEFKVQGIYHDFWITQVSDKKLLGDFYFAVGLGYQLLKGKENKLNALRYFQDAEGIIEALKEFDRLFEVYNEIGIAYYDLKKNDMAYNYYNLTYNLALNNKLHNYKIATSLVNLSALDTEKGEYKIAINKLNKALELIDYNPTKNYKEEIRSFLGSVYKNLALNYFQLFEYEETIKYYKLGLKFIRNREIFLSRVINRIQFIMKDIEDESEKKSIEDLIAKIHLLR